MTGWVLTLRRRLLTEDRCARRARKELVWSGWHRGTLHYLPRALPRGWRLLYEEDQRSAGFAYYALLAHEAGGYALARIEVGHEVMLEAFATGVTLASLHQHCATLAGADDPSAPPPASQQVVETYLSGLYDCTDPVENAERMLVALGQPLTLMPQVATRR